MAISKDTIKHTAHLARIDLSPKELEKLSGQLKEIISFIDQLKKLKVEDVSPTSHILPLANVLRQDQPQPSLASDDALKNAPKRQGSFFAVPKVIE